jgi:hypothetical protein
MSVAPPGAKGTIKVMGRVGNGACCACAGAAGRINAGMKIASAVRANDRAISKPPRILTAPQLLEALGGRVATSISPVDFFGGILATRPNPPGLWASANLLDPGDPSNEKIPRSIRELKTWTIGMQHCD